MRESNGAKALRLTQQAGGTCLRPYLTAMGVWRETIADLVESGFLVELPGEEIKITKKGRSALP